MTARDEARDRLVAELFDAAKRQDWNHQGLAALLEKAARALTQARETPAPVLQKADNGKLVDCSPREFAEWLRRVAESHAHMSDIRSWALGIASRGVDKLVAASVRPASPEGEQPGPSTGEPT
jgi:hypothetical protein